MSVRLNGTTGLPLDGFFMKFYIWIFFENLSRKFKFRYNRTRISGIVREGRYTFWSCLAEIFLGWETIEIKVVEKIKIHILRSVPLFEKCKKNAVEPERPLMTIWRIRISLRVPGATHTHTHTRTRTRTRTHTRTRAHTRTREYEILIAFPRQYWLHERA
jgi:hypothetical protein